MKHTISELPPDPDFVLKLGDSGEHVDEWQSILSVDCEYGIAIDGKFGLETAYCTKLLQAARGLPQTGTVDYKTWDAAIDRAPPTKYTKILTSKFTPAFRCKIDLLVVHTMESPHKGDTAERVATWLARADSPKASAHYFIDCEGDVVQSVADHNVAWGAPGANAKGLHFEHAGFAKFTRAQWLEEPQMKMLRTSARLLAEKARKYNIPIKLVDVGPLKSGERGITGHKHCTDAFSNGAGHWDPGPGWPWDVYLKLVNGEKV